MSDLDLTAHLRRIARTIDLGQTPNWDDDERLTEAADKLDAHAAEVDALRQQLQRALGRECGALCRDLEEDRDTLEAERDQLRKELEEARAALTELAPASLGAELAELDEATTGGKWQWATEKRFDGGTVLTPVSEEAAREGEALGWRAMRRYVTPWQPAPAAGDTAGQDGAA